MTEINPCGWLQNAGSTHTAEQLRSYMGTLLAVPSAASSLKAASGVHPGLGGSFAVTQNGTPNMSVNVASGLGAIAGTEGSKQGTYFVENDGTVNKAVAASDPTNPRIDLVVAKVQDAFYSGGTNAWSLAVVTGTPAGSPSPPTAPVNSITLAQITVAANATSIVNANITDKRPFNAALGGFVLCTSTVRPSVLYNGLMAYETDTKRPIYSDGSGWNQFGVNIVTSSTRPGSPFTGLRIYETDTKYFYFWNGTKWMREEFLITVTADQPWTSNTTYADITSGTVGNAGSTGGLGFNGEANARYDFELRLHQTSSTGQLNAQIVQPSGSRLDFVITPGVNTGGTYYNTVVQNATAAGVGAGQYSTGSGARIGGSVLLGATPGTVKFQFSQVVSSANTSFVLAGTTLRVVQVA